MSSYNDTPLVTIAIPTYNRAGGYLKTALESALSQTYANIEILVSDNCSTDQTRALVQGYSDDRIRYHRQTRNIPANDNFNYCLGQAKGAWFLLLHDDDLVDSEFVRSCIEHREYNESVGIIRTGARIIDSQGGALVEKENSGAGSTQEEFVKTWLRGQSLMFLCSTLFNTRRLRGIGGFGSKYHLFQDVLAEFELAFRHGRTDIREVRASFRKHESQHTACVRIDEWLGDSIYLQQSLLRWFPQDPEIKVLSEIHFSKHNYEIAKDLVPVWERYKAYGRIYSAFERRYSPIKYFYQGRRRALFKQLGKAKRTVLRGGAQN